MFGEHGKPVQDRRCPSNREADKGTCAEELVQPLAKKSLGRCSCGGSQAGRPACERENVSPGDGRKHIARPLSAPVEVPVFPGKCAEKQAFSFPSAASFDFISGGIPL